MATRLPQLSSVLSITQCEAHKSLHFVTPAPHPSHTSPWQYITQPADAACMWAWTVACPRNVWYPKAARCAMMISVWAEKRLCRFTLTGMTALYFHSEMLVEGGSHIIFDSVVGVAVWLRDQTADLWMKWEWINALNVRAQCDCGSYNYYCCFFMILWSPPPPHHMTSYN